MYSLRLAKCFFVPPANSMTQLTLNYGRAPIRVLVSSTHAWFCATDVFHANRRKTDRAWLSHFSPEHLSLEEFRSDAGSVRLTSVSPLGVATIAKALASPLDRALDAWARREANQLAAIHGFPRLEISLLADGTHPVRPRATHEKYEAWEVLSALHPRPLRNPRNPLHPALFDEDPSLPPHDPAGDRARLSALLGLGIEDGKAGPQSTTHETSVSA